MGAVIVLHKPVSIGFNQYKTHPRYSDGKKAYSIHAEISALLRARCDVTDGTIYVYRQDRRGNIRMAKPCSNCMAALVEAGIKRVYYTVNSVDWESIDL